MKEAGKREEPVGGREVGSEGERMREREQPYCPTEVCAEVVGVVPPF